MLLRDSKMTAKQTATSYPPTASALAMAAGSLMIAAGLLILAVSAFVIPHMNTYFSSGNFPRPYGGYPPFNATGGFQGIPSFVRGIVSVVGSLELIAGVVVVSSGAMLRSKPDQRVLWGTLILVLSVLSFFGSGGFVIGAILGIIGGIMALTWRQPAAQGGP